MIGICIKLLYSGRGVRFVSEICYLSFYESKPRSIPYYKKTDLLKTSFLRNSQFSTAK